MYNQIKSCLEQNHLLPIKGEVLAVSGMGNFYSLVDTENAQIIETQYPEVDMQNMQYKDNTFDFVISDQVLEHIENPIRAINESYRILKSRGIAIHTTCFINYIHPCPRDFWRFSPEALTYLCKDFSNVLLSQGWGNRIAICLCLIGNRFRFLRIPENRWSIRRIIATFNEDNYPLVTWIVAQK